MHADVGDAQELHSKPSKLGTCRKSRPLLDNLDESAERLISGSLSTYGRMS